MGASVGRGRKGPIVEINVTPLVDVVLVLLIIFMVVTNISEEPNDAGIPIELPGAASAESIGDPQAVEPLTVAVASDGQLVLRGRLADTDAVKNAVRNALAVQGPNLEVVVAADKSATHDRFVALLDLLRAEGVSRFAIQTDGGPTGG